MQKNPAVARCKLLTLLLLCCARGSPLCVSEVIVMLAEIAMCQAVSVARRYHLFH